MSNNFSALTEQDIAAWYRSKAKEYAAMADTIEKRILANHNYQDQPQPTLPKLGMVTLPQLMKRLKEKSARINYLAESFNVPPQMIQNLVDQSEGKIVMAERGWLKVVE